MSGHVNHGSTCVPHASVTITQIRASMLVIYARRRILCGMTATHGESTTTGWVPDDSAFGARLAMIRYQKGWGGAAVAGERTDVRPETWRSWENQTNKNPRNYEAIVAKIARKAGCDAGWLYGGKPLEGAIDLDRLEDGLNRGLPGAVAVALSLTHDVDPQAFAGATSQPKSIPVKDTEEYPVPTERPSPIRTNAYPASPPRPAGRPQTSQTSLTGPKPTRPTRLRRVMDR